MKFCTDHFNVNWLHSFCTGYFTHTQAVFTKADQQASLLLSLFRLIFNSDLIYENVKCQCSENNGNSK